MATNRPPITGRQWAALAVLTLPVLLIAVDMTVLGFAVPFLSEDLDPSAGQLLWIVDVYGLVLAGLLITMGGVADRVGRRKLLLIGSVGFAAASVIAAYSTSPEMLIAARVLLGVAGGTLMPTTLASIRHVFPDDRQRILAIAVWGSAFSAGAAAGPIIGGWLLTHFWWGSVFLMAAPVSLVVVLAAPFVLPESRDPRPGPLDFPSVALSFFAMVPFAYSVKHFATDGFNLVSVAALLAAVVSGYLFVKRQQRLEHPLMDLDLFRVPRFSASVATNFTFVFAHIAAMFLLTQYLQLVLGYSPMQAGVILIPGLVLAVASHFVAVRLSQRLSLATIIGWGTALATIGFLVITQTSVDSGAALVALAFAAVGTGLGLAETVTNDAIMTAAPAHRAGAASAISETGYELGGALGVAVLGSVATAVYQSELADAPASARQTLAGALETAGGMEPEAGGELVSRAQQAFTDSLDVAAFIGAGLLIAVGTVVVLVLRRDARRRQETETAAAEEPKAPVGV
ncbi:MFS transporter [Salininema proteolyticum]|uniref:MFS transporter n=1 Tax=Salininema proteolyticum TaxID=1607685 RepID=A0ABV8U164_9ACTN